VTQQRTIKDPVSIEGAGLQTGSKTKLIIISVAIVILVVGYSALINRPTEQFAIDNVLGKASSTVADSEGHIVTIELASVKLTTEDMEALASLRNVRELSFIGSVLPANAMEVISSIRTLRTLSLASTSVTDMDLVDLVRCRELKLLDLNNTAVTDASLQHLSRMTALRRLFINNTKISEAGESELRRLLPDCFIQAE